MARFRLTLRAEADLLEIAEYTLRTWGEEQCARYTEDGFRVALRVLGPAVLQAHAFEETFFRAMEDGGVRRVLDDPR